MGQLIAVARGTDRSFEATDASDLHDALTAELSRDGEIFSVRIADDHAHSVAADVTDAGDVILRVSGPPSLGEMGVGRTAQTLIGHLNSRGASWGPPVDVSNDQRSPGVDCEARDRSGQLLQVQVVRADVTRSLWRAFSEAGRLEARYTVAELARLVLAAIEQKKLKGSPDVVLALDAGILASHAMARVAYEVQAKFAVLSTGSTFASVWLVGPSPALVWRLDETNDGGQSG